MPQPANLLKLVKLPFLALLLLAIAYGANSGFKKSDQKKKLVVPEMPVAPISSNTTLKDSVVAYGMKFLGTPYLSAGCSKDGFDCSGFVYFVYKHFKIEVPRSSSEFDHFGTEIPLEKVQKGDILVFLSPTRNAIGHIGMVCNPKGKASDFIHASSGREMKVIITSLATEGYTRRFVKAVRIL